MYQNQMKTIPDGHCHIAHVVPLLRRNSVGSSAKLRRLFGEEASLLRRYPSTISPRIRIVGAEIDVRSRFLSFLVFFYPPVSCLFRTKQLVSQMLKYCHFIGQLLRHKTLLWCSHVVGWSLIGCCRPVSCPSLRMPPVGRCAVLVHDNR